VVGTKLWQCRNNASQSFVFKSNSALGARDDAIRFSIFLQQKGPKDNKAAVKISVT